MSSSTSNNNTTSQKFILLYGIYDDLFKACFGKDKEWPCKLVSLPKDCDRSLLSITLSNPNLTSVVIDSIEIPHWDTIIQHYKNGGFVTFFGIIGEYAIPDYLGQIIGRPWKFYSYTRITIRVTDIGNEVLGADADITGKEVYVKCNFVNAPAEDRIMSGKLVSFDEYVRENYGIEKLDNLDMDDMEDVNEARRYYPNSMEEQNRQAPLVMHRANNGGKFAYLGFVNGDGMIPVIVRKLLSCTK
mmetsp:Transcript_609/g.1104  ORF Transcript_609/g.1104 Transcript_609/m.1104 type:complete len:244 (+) Transcript_609:39-770(+)